MGCSPVSCFSQNKRHIDLYLDRLWQDIPNAELQDGKLAQMVSSLDKDQLLQEAHKLLRHHRVNQAKTCYQMLIQNGKENPEDIVGLGCVQEQVGHYEHNLIQWYFQNNRCTNAYDALNICYLWTKEYNKAEQWYKQQFIRREQDYRLAIGLAHSYFNQKNYQQASKYYTRTIQIKKDFDRPYQALAVISKLQKKDEKQVRKWAEAALTYNPQNIFAHFLLAISEQLPINKLKSLKKASQLNSKYGRIYNAMGNTYKREGKIKKAIQSYKKCINLAPKYQASYIGLANIYREKQMYKQALQYLENSLQINPRSELAYIGLGNVYNEMQDFEKAIDYYQKSIEINAQLAASYYGIGVALKAQRKYAEAKELLQKAINLNQQYQFAIQELGCVYLQLGQWQRSIQQYSKALALNPKKASLYFWLGQAYIRSNDIENAKIYFEKSLWLEPQYIESLCAIGNIHFRCQQYEQAIQLYKKCINKDNKYEWAYYHLGKLYKKLKEYDNAQTNLEKCLEINCKNYYALNALANVYCQQGRESQAIGLYQQSIQCNPSSFYSHYCLANAYFMLNDYDASIKQYSAAVALQSDNYLPYNGLGNCCKSMDNLQEATKWYHRAVQLNPDSDAAYYGIANIYSIEQNYLEAQKYFLKALEKNNNNTLCKMNLGIAYLKMQNFKKAFELITSAKDSIDQDERLTITNQSYLQENIKIFEQEAEDWEIRKKTGFITEESRAHLNQIIQHFQAKVKLLYNPVDSASKINKKMALNPGMLKIINLLYEDKFTLTEMSSIFSEVHKLFYIDQDYFHIIPQILCQFFWSHKFLYKQSINDIQAQLTQLLESLAEQLKNKARSASLPFDVQDYDEEISLKLFQPQATKVNLFKDTQFFPSYQELYSQIKAVNKKASMSLEEFHQLIKFVKKQAKGFSEIENLKLPDNSKNQFKVMLRIMEKMFREVRSRKQKLIQRLDQILDQMEEVTIESVLHQIVRVWTGQIDSILQSRIERRKPTACYLSDLVRGKIFFNSPRDIGSAVRFSQEYCIKKQYSIFECENRLLKPETRDVVLKIEINEIVCELQLALKQNTTSYHFDHSIYEILRSPLGCIFGSYVFMSKGVKYPLLQNCKDIRERLKKSSSLKDRVIVRKVQYVIKVLEAQHIPCKTPLKKRTKSQEQLKVHSLPPVKKSPRRKLNKTKEI